MFDIIFYVCLAIFGLTLLVSFSGWFIKTSRFAQFSKKVASFNISAVFVIVGCITAGLEAVSYIPYVCFGLSFVFMVFYIIFTYSEYLKNEMLKSNWLSAAFYNNASSSIWPEDLRYGYFLNGTNFLVNSSMTGSFLEGKSQWAYDDEEMIVDMNNKDNDISFTPSASINFFYHYMKQFVTIKKSEISFMVEQGWYQKRFIYLYEKAKKDDYIDTDAVPEIYKLCKESQRGVLFSQSLKEYRNQQIKKIVGEQLDKYLVSVTASYNERFISNLAKKAELFSDVMVSKISADVFSQVSSIMSKREPLKCYIVDDSLSVGTFKLKITDYGLTTSSNYFRQAGLATSILRGVVQHYIQSGTRIEADNQYHVLPGEIIEEEGERYLELLFTCERDPQNAIF